MTFQREPILEKLLPFVHADDAGADYLVSGNYYEWYAGYLKSQISNLKSPNSPGADATRLAEVRDGMFRPTSFAQSQEHVVGACNGHTAAERWAGETEPFARAIARVLANAATSPLVVDYGCGCGRLAKELLRQRPECFVLGIDTSAEQRALADEYVASNRFEAAVPASLNDGEGTADLVYSVYVLQHVPAIELRDVLRRIHRVLKPRGLFAYCGSDYRLAVSARGFFDDRFLGVDVRQEIERLFVEERDLFDLSGESQLIRDMITADGCPPGSIAHPAKVYRKR